MKLRIAFDVGRLFFLALLVVAPSLGLQTHAADKVF